MGIIRGMAKKQRSNPDVIGLTGSFGSGCSYIAANVLKPMGYKVCSLSDILREVYRAENGGETGRVQRHVLQAFGDQLRQREGRDALARRAIERIEKDRSSKWVVDSIRNPAEIHLLRNESNRFFVFGVYAEKEKRWERVKGPDKYDGDRKGFDEDDENDTGMESEEYGQRVGDCFSEADVVLSNNSHFDAVGNQDFEAFAGNVRQYADLVSAPLAKKAPLKPEEALMAMAYAAGQRSSCPQRKVGAVIADAFGNVVSSGFNEVPKGEQPCSAQYRECFRRRYRDTFFEELTQKGLIVHGKKSDTEKAFSRHFRILDVCRALHAEENAILNLVRTGRSVPLSECTLYTTTYPCRLCAKKIANLEFARIVYLEPYPDQEAKVILKGAGVDDEFFEGVTFRAYFRIYGEQR